MRVLIDDQTGKCNGALCRRHGIPLSECRRLLATHALLRLQPPSVAACSALLRCLPPPAVSAGLCSGKVCGVALLPAPQSRRASAHQPPHHHLIPVPLLFPSYKAGIGFVNYTSAEAARAAQEAMNGVSMGDRLLHVMVQNPAGRPGRNQSSTPIGAPAVGMAQLAGVQGLQTSRPQLPPSVFQAANNLGLSASTLASLQAGLMPASAGMPLQSSSLPLAVGGQTYNGTMAGQPTSFGSLQW